MEKRIRSIIAAVTAAVVLLSSAAAVLVFLSSDHGGKTGESGAESAFFDKTPVLKYIGCDEAVLLSEGEAAASFYFDGKGELVFDGEGETAVTVILSHTGGILFEQTLSPGHAEIEHL